MLYDAAQGKIMLLVAGFAMPLPTLESGTFATITLQGAPTASGEATAISLSDVSLGDSEGGTVTATVGLLTPNPMTSRIYLPTVIK